MAAPVEEAPKESPQVQKLVAMYPNLIARIAPYGKFVLMEKNVILISQYLHQPLKVKLVMAKACIKPYAQLVMMQA